MPGINRASKETRGLHSSVRLVPSSLVANADDVIDDGQDYQQRQRKANVKLKK